MRKKLCFIVSIVLLIATIVSSLYGYLAYIKYDEYSKLETQYDNAALDYYESSGYDSMNDLRKIDSYYNDLYNKSHRYLYQKNKYDNLSKTMCTVCLFSAFFSLLFFIFGKRSANEEQHNTDTDVSALLKDVSNLMK